MGTMQRVIGTEDYINKTTGEIIAMNIVESVEYQKDLNFHKVFLTDFIKSLEGITNAKTAICFWILTHLTKDNQLLYSYRQISEKTGYSYKIVADTMQLLLDRDFLCRFCHGHYMVNPSVIFKGSYQRRCSAVRQYNQSKHKPTTAGLEQRIKSLDKDIERLQKAKAALEKQQDSIKKTHKEKEEEEETK